MLDYLQKRGSKNHRGSPENIGSTSTLFEVPRKYKLALGNRIVRNYEDLIPVKVLNKCFPLIRNNVHES